MIPAALPDLDGLDLEALKALVIAQAQRVRGTAQAAQIERARDRTSEAGHREVPADDLRQEEREADRRSWSSLSSGSKNWRLRKPRMKLRRLRSEAAQPRSTQTDSKRRSRPHASLFLKIFRVKWSPIFPRITAAPIAAARCASSAKMFPNNWSAFRQPTR